MSLINQIVCTFLTSIYWFYLTSGPEIWKWWWNPRETASSNPQVSCRRECQSLWKHRRGTASTLHPVGWMSSLESKRATYSSLILTHILRDPGKFLTRRLPLRGSRDCVPADEVLDALSTSISSFLPTSPVSSLHFTLVKRDQVGIGHHFHIAS